MRIDFDWAQIYSALVSQSSRPQKSAFAAARQIENDIYQEGWPAGEVFGDQADLIHRYGISRAILREAVRLLEDRHVARMRRGPGGGLVVLAVSASAIARAVAGYFNAIGVTSAQLQQARMTLAIVAAYRQALSEGPAAMDAFTNEFRAHLRIGPGAGLLNPGVGACQFAMRARDAGCHVITHFLAGCLDATERCRRAQSGDPDSQGWGQGTLRAGQLLSQGRAHELARKLALELPQARSVAQRVSTEDQLCERHHVGREVVRQAIRVLESRGLIDCQRGRTHGVHAGASDAAALVELVVAYLSSIRLGWEEFFPDACILSRIVRISVAAQFTREQRLNLLHRLDCARRWSDAPSLITAQLHSEWACVSNPILTFMEQCSTAYYARASAGVWRSFEDSELKLMQQQIAYTEAIARGDLVRADSLVERICAHICRSRDLRAFDPITAN